MAELYKDRSVAEQNSFDIGKFLCQINEYFRDEAFAVYSRATCQNIVLTGITWLLRLFPFSALSLSLSLSLFSCPFHVRLAWNLLMEERFEDFRETLCYNRRELSRFRQLVVNSVMATDLGDKELKALRNGRWDKAFKLNDQEPKEQPVVEKAENPRDDVNRKATIVIEHLLQAADVAHTMQHWQIYRKWVRTNKRVIAEFLLKSSSLCCQMVVATLRRIPNTSFD